MASQSRHKAKSVAVTPQECSKGVKAKVSLAAFKHHHYGLFLAKFNSTVTLTALSAFLECCI